MTDATKRFDSFIVLAEMRTGSNFLEANLNEMPGVVCHGEAFNRHFIGQKNKADLFGITLAMREADPLALLAAMKSHTAGLPGFRYFHDHDPRVFDACLPDPRCAKIVLTRNPLESYVSLKIASQTGQWLLKDAKHQKSAQVRFDPAEFEAHMTATQAFQMRIQHGLQTTGQTAFYISYEDIADVAVLNGLAAFLGVRVALEAPSRAIKKQNPEEITEKVVNPAEMEAALARLDRFNLNRTPVFEPRRGAMVPNFQAAPRSPLLYQPIRSTGEARLTAWLAALDGKALADVQQGFSHKSFRQWKRKAVGHLAFTLIRHPLARAHTAFCDQILSNAMPEVRSTLKRGYKVPLPEPENMGRYDLAAHRAAFLAFLGVLKANLAGQTSMRIDGAWASQAACIQGFAQVHAPDLVIREDRAAEGLAYLAGLVGRPCPNLSAEAEAKPFHLAQIHDAELEAAARDAYQRDYQAFGFADWAPPAA